MVLGLIVILTSAGMVLLGLSLYTLCKFQEKFRKGKLIRQRELDTNAFLASIND